MPADRSGTPTKRHGKLPVREPVIDLFELDDVRLGIADPAVAQMALCVFSRILGTSTGRRPYVTLVNQVLAGAGRAPFRRPDGVREEAPFPDLPDRGWSRACSVDKRIAEREGQPPDLTRLWLAAQDDGAYAMLPLHYVCQYFPPIVWPVAAKAISEWGAAGTQERFGRFIRQESQRPSWHAKRKGELLSDGTLVTLIEGTSVFLRAAQHWLDQEAAGARLPDDLSLALLVARGALTLDPETETEAIVRAFLALQEEGDVYGEYSLSYPCWFVDGIDE